MLGLTSPLALFVECCVGDQSARLGDISGFAAVWSRGRRSRESGGEAP